MTFTTSDNKVYWFTKSLSFNMYFCTYCRLHYAPKLEFLVPPLCPSCMLVSADNRTIYKVDLRVYFPNQIGLLHEA